MNYLYPSHTQERATKMELKGYSQLVISNVKEILLRNMNEL